MYVRLWLDIHCIKCLCFVLTLTERALQRCTQYSTYPLKTCNWTAGGPLEPCTTESRPTHTHTHTHKYFTCRSSLAHHLILWMSIWAPYTWGEGDMVCIYPGQTEVCNLDLPSTAHKHIVWLQVPMNDSVSVEEVKSAEQLTHHILYKEKGKKNTWTHALVFNLPHTEWQYAATLGHVVTKGVCTFKGLFFNGLSCWQCKMTFFVAKTYINVTLDHKISHKGNFFLLCITWKVNK